VLQSGIEIFAQPPGKKLENIALLSGGEKTMTAVALLFATYMVHPSPFCLLDEIDAALDEANVGRFVAILNEFSSVSQYFVITHNRRTALGARTLIGITMAESGVSTKLDVRLSEGGDPDFVAADITPFEDEDVPPEEGIVIPPHPPRRQQAAISEEVPNATP
jgi:chromosome segregation protein